MYIAVDIGGTNIRIASFEQTNPSSQLKHKKIPTCLEYKKGLEEVIKTIHELADGEKINAVGISIASGISADGKTIINPNIPEWKAENLVPDLISAFHANVKIINDGTAGGIAEMFTGSGKDLDSFTFLAWGTGLGGVTIKKTGKVFDIYEVEPGHLKIRGDGRKCECGKADCIESYVGGLAVEKRLGKRMSTLAENEWDEILDYMRAGINQILEKHPVDNVIFDGRVILEHPDFVKKLEGTVNDDYPTWVNFEQSSIGDEAPLYGALISLRQDLNFQIHKEF